MNFLYGEWEWSILRIPSWLCWEFVSVSGEDISTDFIDANFFVKMSDINLMYQMKKIWRGQRLFVFLTSEGFFGGEEAKYFWKRPLINSGT